MLDPVALASITGLVGFILHKQTPPWLKDLLNVVPQRKRLTTTITTITTTTTRREQDVVVTSEEEAIRMSMRKVLHEIQHRYLPNVTQINPATLWYLLQVLRIKITTESTQVMIRNQLQDKILPETNGIPSEHDMKELQYRLQFAMWAYTSDADRLRTKLLLLANTSKPHGGNYKLIRLEAIEATIQRVSHYLAYDAEQKELVVGIKGTETLADAITNFLGDSVEFELDSDPFTTTSRANSNKSDGAASTAQLLRSNRRRANKRSSDSDAFTTKTKKQERRRSSVFVRRASLTRIQSTNENKKEVQQEEEPKYKLVAHEGMMKAALELADKVLPMVEILSPNRIVICGHSLGGGVASLLGIILRSKVPPLKTRGRLHVYAFGNPPILPKRMALQCTPFLTSVVNRYDIVPIMCIYNFQVTLEALAKLRDVLKAKGYLPQNPIHAAMLLHKLKEQQRSSSSSSSTDRNGMPPDSIGGNEKEATIMVKPITDDNNHQLSKDDSSTILCKSLEREDFDVFYNNMLDEKFKEDNDDPFHLTVPGKVILMLPLDHHDRKKEKKKHRRSKSMVVLSSRDDDERNKVVAQASPRMKRCPNKSSSSPSPTAVVETDGNYFFLRTYIFSEEALKDHGIKSYAQSISEAIEFTTEQHKQQQQQQQQQQQKKRSYST